MLNGITSRAYDGLRQCTGGNPQWALAEENGAHADGAALEQIGIDDRARRGRMNQPDGSSVSERVGQYQSIRHSSDTPSVTLLEVDNVCVLTAAPTRPS